MMIVPWLYNLQFIRVISTYITTQKALPLLPKIPVL